MIRRAIAVWFLILGTVALNGGLREPFLVPRLGDLRAHQVGTLLACAAALLVIFLTLPWLRLASLRQALGAGALWLLIAVVFELGFFHFLAGVPWTVLLADYDLASGRLLILLWVSTLFGPVLAFILRSQPG